MNLEWLPCSNPDCDNGLVIDQRHRDNLTATPWLCVQHEEAR